MFGLQAAKRIFLVCSEIPSLCKPLSIEATQLVVVDDEDDFCPVVSTDLVASAGGAESLHKALVREGTMFGLAKLEPLTLGAPPSDSKPVEGNDRSVQMEGKRNP